MWKWALLVVITVAVTVPLTYLGVPSAALFAALIVGIALALLSLAPTGMPRKAGIAAQGVLGVYIGTMVQRDALTALGSDWPIVLGVAIATLVLSIFAGALLGLHRDVSPLTGALALVAGGASGLVAIARELGGDDRVVAVVQYLRVALITASMPVVVTTMALVGLAWAAASRTRLCTVPTLALVLGLVVSLYAGAAGAFGGAGLTTVVGCGVLGLLAAGGLLAYLRSSLWAPAVVGVLALAALVLRISSDSLGPVLAVLLSGLVLLGVGAVLLLRRRSAERT